LMASAKVLVIPRHQALPLVVGEAMSLGIPIVAYDYSPVLGEIYGQAGPFIVRRIGDAKAFAEAILKMLSLSPDERLKLSRPLGKNMKPFTWEATMMRERIIYENILRAYKYRELYKAQK